MTGRSAPGYHLYRFPPVPGPCLLYVATFDITIPPDDASPRRSIPRSDDLDGFSVLGESLPDHR